MADKRITDFATLEDIQDDDLILVASEDETYNMKILTLINTIADTIKTIESKTITLTSSDGNYLGDINGDGKIDNQDIIAINRYLDGITSTIAASADINGDGKIDSEDAAILSAFRLSGLAGDKYAIARIKESYTDDTSYTYYAYVDKSKITSGGGGNLTDKEKELILNLFRNAAYASDSMEDTLTQLEALWNNSSEAPDDGGDSGDTHTHSYTASVTTPASCTVAGVKTYACSCGNSYTESIPATGHNYVNGMCSVCGAAAPESKAEIFEPETNSVVSASLDQTNTQIDITAGTTSNATSWVASDYTEIPSGNDYIVIQCTEKSVIRYALYDSEKSFINGAILANIVISAIELPENTAYIRLSSNNTTIEPVTMTVGKNMVTSWGTTTDNHMNQDGTITTGYTGTVQQKINNGYVKIPDNVDNLIWFNRNGYSFRHVAVAVYDNEYGFVGYDYFDYNMEPAHAKTMDLTTMANAAYFKAAAWYSNDPATNNNPSEQIVFGCY